MVEPAVKRLEGLSFKTDFTSFEEADSLVEEHFERFFKPFLSMTTKEQLDILKPAVQDDGFEAVGVDVPDMGSSGNGPAAREISHDEHLISGIVKQYQALRDVDYELIVIGNTNVGKSTFLNNLTKMKQFFNTSVNRETANVWRFRVVEDTAQDMIFKMTEYEIDPQSVADSDIKTLQAFS